MPAGKLLQTLLKGGNMRLKRTLRNLLFIFIMFCGGLSLVTFSLKAINDSGKNTQLETKQETAVKIKPKKITYHHREVKLMTKLLIY
jgi:hypothetical protein